MKRAGGVSGRSLGALAILVRLTILVASLPWSGGDFPHQSAWIAAAAGSVLAVPFMWLMVAAVSGDPPESLIAKARSRIGRWAVPVLAPVVAGYWLITAATYLRTTAEAFVVSSMPSTPVAVLMLPLAVVSAGIARRGIGLVCALADLLGIVACAVVLLVVAAAAGQFQLLNLKPPLPDGVSVLTVQVVETAHLWSPASLIWMVYPRITDEKKRSPLRALLAAVGVGGFLIVVVRVAIAAALGPLVDQLPYLFYDLARVATIGGFLDQVEVLVMGTWLLGTGAVMAGLYWAAAEAIGEALSVHARGIFTYPLAAASAVLGLSMFEDAMELRNFISLRGSGALELAVIVGISVLMLIGDWLRRPRGRQTAACVLALCFIAAGTSGCWDRREIETLGFVTACAIDTADAGSRPADAGLVQVSVQLVKPWALSMGERDSTRERAFSTETATGLTVFEAVRNLNEASPRRPFWSHNRWLLFGEGFARAGVETALDFFARDGETRILTQMAVLDGGRGWDLLWAEFEMEPLPAEGGRGMLLGATSAIGTTVSTTLKDFLIALEDPGADPVAPRVVIVAYSDKPSVSGDLLRDEIETTAQLSGLAVFRDDRLVGWLDRAQTRGYNWIRGKVDSTIISIPAPDADDPHDFRQYLSLEVLRAGSRVRVEADDESGKVRATVEVTVKAAIGEARPPLKLEQEEVVFSRIEQLMAEEVRREALDAVEHAQRLEADIFGFGRLLMASDPKAWRRLEDRWRQVFREMEVDVQVKATIRRTGLASGRFTVR